MTCSGWKQQLTVNTALFCVASKTKVVAARRVPQSGGCGAATPWCCRTLLKRCTPLLPAFRPSLPSMQQTACSAAWLRGCRSQLLCFASTRSLLVVVWCDLRLEVCLPGCWPSARNTSLSGLQPASCQELREQRPFFLCDLAGRLVCLDLHGVLLYGSWESVAGMSQTHAVAGLLSRVRRTIENIAGSILMQPRCNRSKQSSSAKLSGGMQHRSRHGQDRSL